MPYGIDRTRHQHVVPRYQSVSLAVVVRIDRQAVVEAEERIDWKEMFEEILIRTNFIILRVNIEQIGENKWN